ncbi:MAG: hypothetical protein AABY11_03845, partial [archaeon]
MVRALTFEVESVIGEMAQEAGIDASTIREKMNEKMEKFSGLLTEQGALILLCKDLKLKMPGAPPNEKIKIGALSEGMNNVDVEGKIKIMDRVKPFSKNGKEGKYVSTRIHDETGEAIFTLWNEQVDHAMEKRMGVGSTIVLTNARVGNFNGMKQLSLGYNGTCEVGEGVQAAPYEKEKVAGKESEKKDVVANETPLASIKENQWFEGDVHIVDVMQGKGYYVRCTACQ